MANASAYRNPSTGFRPLTNAGDCTFKYQVNNTVKSNFLLNKINYNCTVLRSAVLHIKMADTSVHYYWCSFCDHFNVSDSAFFGCYSQYIANSDIVICMGIISLKMQKQ